MEAEVEDSYGHHDPLPDDIIYAVKPTDVHPAGKELLQRFIRGATQNSSEPYRGLLWSFAQLGKNFVVPVTVEIAANLAVL